LQLNHPESSPDGLNGQWFVGVAVSTAKSRPLALAIQFAKGVIRNSSEPGDAMVVREIRKWLGISLARPPNLPAFPIGPRWRARGDDSNRQRR
jgi:hypothetical protein